MATTTKITPVYFRAVLGDVNKSCTIYVKAPSSNSAAVVRPFSKNLSTTITLLGPSVSWDQEFSYTDSDYPRIDFEVYNPNDFAVSMWGYVQFWDENDLDAGYYEFSAELDARETYYGTAYCDVTVDCHGWTAMHFELSDATYGTDLYEEDSWEDFTDLPYETETTTTTTTTTTEE